MAYKSPMNLRKKKDTGKAKPYSPDQGWTPPKNHHGNGTVDLTPRYRKSSYAPWG